MKGFLRLIRGLPVVVVLVALWIAWVYFVHGPPETPTRLWADCTPRRA